MIELIEGAGESAAKLRRSGTTSTKIDLDGDSVAELALAIHVLERWKNHPEWNSLIATLSSPTEPQHTVMMLAMASYLVDNNNGVGLHVNSGSDGPVADMWITPTLGERIDVEVKTPLRLRSPRSQLTKEEAVDTFESCLRKSKKQLSSSPSSLLVVGGFHLGESRTMLLNAMTSVVEGLRDRRRNLIGIVLADCTFKLDLVGMNDQILAPIVNVEVALHPGYEGGLTVRTPSDTSHSAELPAHRMAP